jgi:hypothetical protein
MSNSNENAPVEEQEHANLFALQEELDTLYAQLGEYEGNYLNRAEARIAEIEAILYRASQPHNASENQNADPAVEEEDPKPNTNQNGGRRRKARKTRKARKASKKTRRTRHKKHSKRR